MYVGNTSTLFTFLLRNTTRIAPVGALNFILVDHARFFCSYGKCAHASIQHSSSTRPLITPQSPTNIQVTVAAVSTTATIIATGSMDATVRLWVGSSPLDLRLELLVRHKAAVTRLVLSLSEHYLVSTTVDNFAYLYSLQSRCMVGSIKVHTAEITAVKFSPDSCLLATASDDGTLRLWRTADLAQVAVYAADAGITHVAFYAHMPHRIQRGFVPSEQLRGWGGASRNDDFLAVEMDSRAVPTSMRRLRKSVDSYLADPGKVGSHSKWRAEPTAR